MFELVDLNGLILEILYKELDKEIDEEGTKKYSLLNDEVDEEITRHTNYTNAMIADSDYSEIKDQLRRPYAWILEYYALSLMNNVTELQLARIRSNYKEAKEMLATFPRYYEIEGNEDSSSTFDIDGTTSW